MNQEELNGGSVVNPASMSLRDSLSGWPDFWRRIFRASFVRPRIPVAVFALRRSPECAELQDRQISTLSLEFVKFCTSKFRIPDQQSDKVLLVPLIKFWIIYVAFHFNELEIISKSHRYVFSSMSIFL